MILGVLIQRYWHAGGGMTRGLAHGLAVEVDSCFEPFPQGWRLSFLLTGL